MATSPTIAEAELPELALSSAAPSTGVLEPLGWSTLLGRHMALGAASRILLTAAAGASAALVGARMLGWNPAAVLRHAGAASLPTTFGPDALHFGAELSVALILVGVGLYLLAFSGTSRESTPAAVGALLVATGGLELLHGATAWRGDAAIEPSSALFSWWVARLFFAFGLVVLPWPGRRGSAAVRRLLVAGTLVAGAAAGWLLLALGDEAPDLLRPSAIVPRPWELLPFALLLFATAFVLGPFHRRVPTPLTHALVVSTIPAMSAQLVAALGWVRIWDADFVLAHLLKLVAASTLGAGLLVDGAVAHRRRLAALEKIASKQIELSRRTAELEQVDRDLVEEARQRRTAEASLRRVEKAVATMSLGATITDDAGRIVFVNAAEAAMHGYAVDELIGRPASIFAPKRADRPAPAATLEGWEPWSRETLNVTRDGRVFPVRLVSDAVLDDEGRPLGMVTICEDISERRETEATLQRRDEVLQAIGFAAERLLAGEAWEEEVPEILRRLGEGLGVDRVCLRAVRGHGDLLPDQTWAGPWLEECAPPLEPDELGPWDVLMARGEPAQARSSDLPRGLRDGPEVAVLAIPVHVAGEWTGLLTFETTDVERSFSGAELTALEAAARTLSAAVQRRLSERALAESESRIKELLQHASDLVQRVDAEDRFRFVNEAWRRTLGYAEPEIESLELPDVLPPASLERYREALASGEAGPLELELRTRDGRPVTVEASLTRSGEDGPASTLAILRNVSERRRVERMKSEFLTIVSHELRTPLTSLLASLSLVRQGLGPAEAEEMLDICSRNGERLLRLINELLDLQKLSAGKLPLDLGPVELRTLLEEACTRIRTVARSRDVRLELEAPAALVAHADRHRLTQVVDNLLSNALKFSPEGSEVAVRARRDGPSHVVVSVADRGPGIPEDERDRLFEAFSQGDGSTTRAIGGTGLGLHIVQGLVRAMDGTVDVESCCDPERAGTVFRVRLPAAEAD